MNGVKAMSRKFEQTMIVALMGGCALLTSRGAHAQATAALTVVIRLEKEVITQHEPVIVDFANRESSSKEAVLDLGYDHEKIDVQVTDPEGRVWPKPHPPPQPDVVKFREVVYGGDVNSVALNDWFNFNKVGRYEMKVVVSSSGDLSSGNMQPTETQLTLIVLPRNEASLALACAKLVARMENSKSAADAITAAKALSSVDDPAAVPFLAQAMKQKSFTRMMIAALARLNTPDAIDALLSASQSSDPETSALARATLASLGETQPPPR